MILSACLPMKGDCGGWKVVRELRHQGVRLPIIVIGHSLPEKISIDNYPIDDFFFSTIQI